jgi:hypothetical protein
MNVDFTMLLFIHQFMQNVFNKAAPMLSISKVNQLSAIPSGGSVNPVQNQMFKLSGHLKAVLFQMPERKKSL